MGCNQSTPVKEVPPASPSAAKKPAPETAAPTCVSVTFGGVSVRYAFLSQRGNYPEDPNKANQDSFYTKPHFGGIRDDAFFGVFDGHGEFGDKCSQFVRDNLPALIAKGIKDPKDLSDDKFATVSQWAHKTCNKKLHSNRRVDDLWSGTTSISVYLQGDGNKIHVSNVGDSRAVLGTKEKSSSSHMSAVALSSDQTPWRRDERKRIISKGGRILTQDQLFGNAPIEKDENGVGNWKSQRKLGDGEKVLGEEIDMTGQPPRVFSPNGDYPGLSVTRTLGDKVIADEGVGVDAEPEVLSRVLNPEDKVIFIASDGVWEFLPNQKVIEMCAACKDPLEACKNIAAKSYDLWMENDTRSDDITMICIFIDDVKSTGSEEEGQ